jgi:DNA helicase HerA-like ATPase
LCLIGASGSGKTHFEKGLIQYALSVGAAEIALVYDHKDPSPSFDGLALRTPAEYIAREPTPEDPPVVVFHDDAPGEPDDVASLGMQLAGAGVPTFTVIDELFPDAVTDGGQGFKNGNASPQALALRTGRSRRASIAFGTQIPQQMPTAIMDLCESQVVFRLQGRGLDYVERTRRIPPEAVSTVKDLQLGQCILISEGAWDGVIYGPDL